MKKAIILLTMILAMLGTVTAGFAEGKHNRKRKPAAQKRISQISLGDVNGDGISESKKRDTADGQSNTIIFGRNRKSNNLTVNTLGGNDKYIKSNKRGIIGVLIAQ